MVFACVQRCLPNHARIIPSVETARPPRSCTIYIYLPRGPEEESEDVDRKPYSKESILHLQEIT